MIRTRTVTFSQYGRLAVLTKSVSNSTNFLLVASNGISNTKAGGKSLPPEVTGKDSKEARNKRIFDLWLACWTNTEIAEQLGCDEKTVREVIGDMASLPKLRKEDAASADHSTNFEVTRLTDSFVHSGESSILNKSDRAAIKKELALILKVSASKLSEWLSDVDQKFREERREKILELYLRCYTAEEIGNEVGLTQQRVDKEIKSRFLTSRLARRFTTSGRSVKNRKSDETGPKNVQNIGNKSEGHNVLLNSNSDIRTLERACGRLLKPSALVRTP